MENVVDALYIATAMLVLIIALTVSISSFTTLKTQVESIVSSDEVIDLAKNEDDSYINYITNSEDKRKVGAETVISSIRRVSRESYTIYISGVDSELSSNKYEWYDSNGKRYLKISTAGTNYKNLTKDNMEEIYECIQDKTFEECIGIYQEALEGVSSANKQTYRIITYEMV